MNQRDYTYQSQEYVLEVIDLTKRFPGVLANDRVSFNVKPGETHGLLGENGAGKSTLAECIFGYYGFDSGTIKLRGENVSFKNPIEALHAGIGMVHQHFSLIQSFTVLENIMLGLRSSLHEVTPDTVTKRFAELMAVYDVKLDIQAKVSQLSVGELQWVEILKSLIHDVDLLILDEPTAVLTPQEADRLYEALQKMILEGLSIVLITHKLREVMAITDRITVLRKGKRISTIATKDTNITALSNLMVGRDIAAICKEERDTRLFQKVLQIENLTATNDLNQRKLHDLSFSIREGEILGLAGVSGNGQKELFEILVGVSSPDQGTLTFAGKDITATSPRERINLGIGFIPDDRQRTGMIGGFSLRDNLILGRQRQGQFRNGLFMSQKNIDAFAEKAVKAFEIDSPTISRPVSLLSGGNQQKVIIAREATKDLKLLLANQPTRGLDVGAIEYVRNTLLNLREKGVGVLLASEDLEELLILADRIAVIYNGRIMDILPCEEASIQRIGLLMAGIKDGAR